MTGGFEFGKYVVKFFMFVYGVDCGFDGASVDVECSGYFCIGELDWSAVDVIIFFG